MSGKEKTEQQLYELEQSPSLKNWGDPAELPKQNISIECGWGRLIFAHTFQTNEDIVNLMATEEDGSRDLALYIRDPQVILALAPQNLFIDPSYTFRLILGDYTPQEPPANPLFTIRLLDPENQNDIDSINKIYASRNMVTVNPEFIKDTYEGHAIKYWVAEEKESNDILAVSMSIDHKRSFDDPENGSSLWSLAVDPQAKHAGIGIALVHKIAEYHKDKGRSFLDLSVLHNNEQAINLYKKLGFVQVPVFCVKNKNAINEELFVGPDPNEEGLNIYSKILINEARRRGIRIEVLDAENNFYRLSKGGTSITCRESLTELTSAIAMSRCADKSITAKILKSEGLSVPDQEVVSSDVQNLAFLKKYRRVVVKPAVGEQGAGITVDVRTEEELKNAIKLAEKVSGEILLEQMVEGHDLRIVVINYKVVAASIRQPPFIVGDGKHTILELTKKQSRRREKATDGESKIPIDDEFERTVKNAGYDINDILPEEEMLQVRKAANLHCGGTMHDVTHELHPDLRLAAERAAKALDIPVTGMDFLVPDHTQPYYVIIEANERPGLANHEPQPTAERFIDLLFPQTIGKEV